ncbi:Uncharacterised protein [Streptococcus suis]|nr:Uncharacterised protein [Streptococcus suis]
MKEFVIRISWYDNRRNFKFKEHIFPTLSIAKMFKRWYRLERGERIELYSRESGEPLI